MKFTTILRTAKHHADDLRQRNIDPRRADLTQPGAGRDVQLEHCLWMLDEITTLIMRDDADAKAARWLCFVQGVLWSHGYVTIDELRELNRDT